MNDYTRHNNIEKCAFSHPLFLSLSQWDLYIYTKRRSDISKQRTDKMQNKTRMACTDPFSIWLCLDDYTCQMILWSLPFRLPVTNDNKKKKRWISLLKTITEETELQR